jgi:osmoprotectant transport system ATP-binding protein
MSAFSGLTPLGEVPADGFGHTFTVAADTLRAALDAAVLSPAGQAVAVDDAGRVAGVLGYEQIRAAVQAAAEFNGDSAGDLAGDLAGGDRG